MKAILCTNFGDASVLHLGDTEAPKLQAGQIRLRVRAFGINRADILQRRGLYPAPAGESDILGLEVSGEILEVNSGETHYRVGDRVMALLAGGGYAEEVCVDSALCLPIPPHLSYAEAAAIPEVFITAHHNLFYLGNIKPGETSLLHAGASGVGTAGIQLLRTLKSDIFVTVSSEKKASACAQLGAMPIIYKAEEFAAVIREKTQGKGVDVILDPVGAKYFADNLASLKTSGRLVLIGLMGGHQTSLDLARLLNKRIRIIGSTLRGLPLLEKRAAVARFADSFLKSFTPTGLRPIVDQIFPATAIADAHRRMESNENIGKLVVCWP